MFRLHILRCKACARAWSSTRRDRKCPYCGSTQVDHSGTKRVGK